MTNASRAATTLVVGIAGGTGGGKTTFAAALRAALPAGAVGIVDHDSYYRDLAHLPFEQRCAVNFDHPDALDSALLAAHLDALRDGRAIDKPVYDFRTHTRSAAPTRIEPTPVVIVEGILVLAAPAIRPRLDLKLFVDAPADRRLLRRLRRDVVERGRDVDSVTSQYEATVRPMHDAFVEPSRAHADLVVPGLADFTVALHVAADALRHRLRLG